MLPSRSQVASGGCPCLGPLCFPSCTVAGLGSQPLWPPTRHPHIQWTRNHHSQIGPFSTFWPTICNSENVGPLPKAGKLWPKRKVQGSADRKCRSWTPGFNLRSVLEFSLSNHPTPSPPATPQQGNPSSLPSLERLADCSRMYIISVYNLYGPLPWPRTAHKAHPISHRETGSLPSEMHVLSANGHSPLL